jgi:hypothetical protein
MGGSEKSRLFRRRVVVCRLFRRGVLGDGLGSFADGVLGQFTGQQQTNCRLDFAAGDRRATVVVSQTRGLGGDAFEDVVHEAVHDRHGLRADASVWVDLLQHLVDVDGVRLSSSALLLLVTRTGGLRLAGGLLCSFACWLWRHSRFDIRNEQSECRKERQPFSWRPPVAVPRDAHYARSLRA